MRLGAKIRAVCLAVAAVSVSALMIVTATYALFSDTKTVNSHLAAGTLKVGLIRVSLTGKAVSADGLLVDFAGEENVDLAADGTKVFQMDNIVPGVTQTAVLEVSNEGTTAFDYSVRLVNLTASDGSQLAGAGLKLAEQMSVRVKAGEAVDKTFTLEQYADAGSVVSLGSILAGANAQRFSVTVRFADGEQNNAAQQAGLSFDLQVAAVQKTE